MYGRTNLIPLLFSTILAANGCAPHSNIVKDRTENTALLGYEDANGRQIPVTTKAGWELKRLQILNNMQKGMGNLPDMNNLPDFDLHYTDSIREYNYIRYGINFRIADNERITAFLYIPDRLNSTTQSPAMLALHETDPLGKESVDGRSVNLNLAYGKELAQRGYFVLAPDYPGFGGMKDYDFETDRYQSGTMKGIFAHMRSVDLLCSILNVDPDRIGVIGHSLGGHNSIFVGAFDLRLKVIVSSCGWTGFDYYDIGAEARQKYGGRLGPWALPKYMPLLREKYDLDPQRIPFDFDEIIAAIAPRVFISISPVHDENFNVSGVKKQIENVSKVYKFLGVPENLKVYYPDAKHDFPFEIRIKTYEMINKALSH